MNVGKLYQVKNLYWMLFPSKEIAATTAPASFVSPRCDHAARAAAYNSKYFNCNVSYISPNSIFVFLEKDGEFIKILSTNGEVGWIYLADFYKDDIKEVNQ